MTVTVKLKLKEPSLVSMSVMGIDVSTATGLVVLQWDAEHSAWRTVHDEEIGLPSLPKTCTMVQRTQRCTQLRKAINEAMVKYKPMAVAIEGYGYANAHSLVTLVELGAGVRSALTGYLGLNVRLYEVSPASLKKFVLGKGVGAKEQVILHVFKRWGYEAATNNLADAYVLAQIAAATMSPSPAYPGELTKPQKEVLGVVAKNS